MCLRCSKLPMNTVAVAAAVNNTDTVKLTASEGRALARQHRFVVYPGL